MDDKKINDWVTGIIVASITIMVAAYLFYYILHNWMGGDLTTKLGAFGDFIGGTTGPLLSTVAILGALVAVRISTSELKLQRLESQKSDIFQIIGVIHSECIALLEHEKEYKENPTSPEEPVNRQLVSFFKEYPVIGADDFETAVNMEVWNRVKFFYADELRDVANRLVALRKYLQQYEHLSDKNYYVSEYYKIFYFRYAQKLKQLGYLPIEAMPFYEERHLRYFDSSKGKD
jgi:hypothetical protein